LKKFSLNLLTQRCYLLALLAGFLFTLSFPKWSIAGFAWVAPGLLLYAAMGQGRGKMFRIGWFAGLAKYLSSLYWLLYMPVTFVPILAWLALSAYCAVYTGLWAWLSWRMFPAAVDPANSFQQFAEAGWLARMRWAICSAILWVALEIVLGRFLSGFPWLFLGMSQYKLIPLIQISSITGVYGVSFLLVWFSVSLLCAALALFHRPAVRWVAMGELFPAFLVVGIVCAWGFSNSLQSPKPTRTLDVAMIQPSIPQTMIWDPKENTNRFTKLVQLTEDVLKSKPQLLLWPEAAVPGMLRFSDHVANAVANLAISNQVWMIIGSDDAQLRPGAKGPDDVEYFNSSFLVSPEGKIEGYYQKRRLVIFGEYIPLLRWLPFLKYFTPIEGGFASGTKAIPFVMDKPRVKTGILICFEDVFPDLAREYVDADTDFLINLTNDGWFGESSEQWQHATDAVFRAVENGIPLIRCTNNGLTCWIDANGRLHEYRFGSEQSIHAVGSKVVKIPLLDAGQKRSLTFYTRNGDLFGWSCLGIMVVFELFRRLASRAKV
jgi:apolipoprotein N-acyltransferase